jgi:hydrogenase assembly chaperone HypC/HupF
MLLEALACNAGAFGCRAKPGPHRPLAATLNARRAGPAAPAHSPGPETQAARGAALFHTALATAWRAGCIRPPPKPACAPWRWAAAAFSTPCSPRCWCRLLASRAHVLQARQAPPNDGASRSGRPGWPCAQCKETDNHVPGHAMVDLDGIRKEISLALVDDVHVGDYVILHVGYALSQAGPGRSRAHAGPVCADAGDMQAPHEVHRRIPRRRCGAASLADAIAAEAAKGRPAAATT